MIDNDVSVFAKKLSLPQIADPLLKVCGKPIAFGRDFYTRVVWFRCDDSIQELRCRDLEGLNLSYQRCQTMQQRCGFSLKDVN